MIASIIHFTHSIISHATKIVKLCLIKNLEVCPDNTVMLTMDDLMPRKGTDELTLPKGVKLNASSIVDR